jgi:hypothetical protein
MEGKQNPRGRKTKAVRKKNKAAGNEIKLKAEGH